VAVVTAVPAGESLERSDAVHVGSAAGDERGQRLVRAVVSGARHLFAVQARVVALLVGVVEGADQPAGLGDLAQRAPLDPHVRAQRRDAGELRVEPGVGARQRPQVERQHQGHVLPVVRDDVLRQLDLAAAIVRRVDVQPDARRPPHDVSRPDMEGVTVLPGEALAEAAMPIPVALEETALDGPLDPCVVVRRDAVDGLVGHLKRRAVFGALQDSGLRELKMEPGGIAVEEGFAPLRRAQRNGAVQGGGSFGEREQSFDNGDALEGGEGSGLGWGSHG
jgi:hypothetical protein